MPNFRIDFKSTATMDQIVAVQKALEKIGPGPVTPDYDDYFFSATLDWSTDQRSLNNLMGKLNLTANIVSKVTNA
jgi:hypothetical protein